MRRKSVKPGKWEEVRLVIFNREYILWSWFVDRNQHRSKSVERRDVQKGHVICLGYHLCLGDERAIWGE